MASIPDQVIERLLAHSRDVLPNEGCGYLVGDEDGRVVGFVPIANAAASPTRFMFDPAEQLAAERAVEDAGCRVVGIAHSHPIGEAALSATDVADAAQYDPFGVFLHAVAAPSTGEVRCFRIVDAAAVEVA